MIPILPEDRTLRVTPAIDSAGDACHGCVLLNEDDEKICEVDIYPKERRDAMARLFASAPRIFEMLVEAESLLSVDIVQGYPVSDFMINLRSIIAEATGQREGK